MHYPYLDRLAREIASSRDQRQLVLRAERAGALARYGYVEEAEREIKSLRDANSSFAPDIAAWILVAEGQLQHFSSLAPSAISSFRAAEAIGRAINRVDIRATSSAWMAATEFLKGDVVISVQHAVQSILDSDSRAFATLSRSCLVIADCLNYAGMSAEAGRHYSVAREYASRVGDISMQSLVLFNSAAFAVARLSLADVSNEVIGDEVRSAELAVSSIEHLDYGIGLSSLNALVPLLKAQLKVVAQQWASGRELYEAALRTAVSQGQQRWLAKFLSELALCDASVGDAKTAAENALQATSFLSQCTDLDDRAIAHARIASVFRALKRSDAADTHSRSAQALVAEFRAEQQHLRTEIAPMLTRLPVDLTKK